MSSTRAGEGQREALPVRILQYNDLDVLGLKPQFERTVTLLSEGNFRNEPCPCGSGRKFKKCCGRNQGIP